MSMLWTPYAEEAALDLTKAATTVKTERASPEPPQNVELRYSSSPVPYYAASPNQERYSPQYRYTASPALDHRYTASPAVDYRYNGSPVPYQYAGMLPQYPYNAQAPQISPASTGSGYEDSLHRGTLSPPDSPSSEPKLKDSLSDDPGFQAFERDALRAMAEKNGGSLLGNNPRMRRAVRSTNQNAADDSYKTQRQRNNFAAKQSRDRRKMREIHLALKATYLGNEVARLRAQLAGRVCARCQP